MTEEEAFQRWVSKLRTEWLPHWQDMPDQTFAWWNLLITVLDDACTDEHDNVVVRVTPISASHPSSSAPPPCPPTPGAVPDAQKPEPGACRDSSRERTGRR
jgi:hypothetical protein